MRVQPIVAIADWRSLMVIILNSVSGHSKAEFYFHVSPLVLPKLVAAIYPVVPIRDRPVRVFVCLGRL
jgi:hypothetical protein